jgi:hypothetical protein
MAISADGNGADGGNVANQLLDNAQKFLNKHIKLGGVENRLRLRTAYHINDKLTAEVGADFVVQRQQGFPHIALQYQLERKGRNLGKIHASERGIMYRKDVHVAYKDKAQCTVAGIAGMAMDGTPKFGIDVGNVRPKWLVIAGAVAMYAAGRPLAGTKHFPDDLTIQLPFTREEGQLQAEIGATIQQGRNGLPVVSIRQLGARMKL